MEDSQRTRRRFLTRMVAGSGSMLLAGCQRLSEAAWLPDALSVGEKLSQRALQWVGRRALAQEFTPADLSPFFRSNGTSDPGTAAYGALAANGFRDYVLDAGGLVTTPRSFTLEELKALPSRTQITRHDCVEGWSAIAKWQGVRLSAVLDALKPAPSARFVVFHCADPMEADGTGFYYESIDLDDANHEQTILAYALNDAPLPVANGAPIRLRVERQLGYKHAKYVMLIELVAAFAHIAGGKGGYWEDNGYQWFAGI